MKNERQSRIEPDMSPEAIDKRLRTVSQLHRLGKELRHARYLGKLKEPEAASTGRSPDGGGRGRA